MIQFCFFCLQTLLNNDRRAYYLFILSIYPHILFGVGMCIIMCELITVRDREYPVVVLPDLRG